MTTTTLEECYKNLADMEADVRADYGDEAEELIEGGAYRDLVVSVLWDVQDREVAREFARTTLGYMPHEQVARFGSVGEDWI